MRTITHQIHPGASRCLLSAALLTLASCANPGANWFRGPRPGDEITLFSPLDLPAPGMVRNGAGAPGPEYWQQQADYVMEASLDPETRLVRGRAHVTYTNNSPDGLDYLWLNLEQNIFRKDSIGNLVDGRTAIGMQNAEGNGYLIRHLRSGGKKLPFHVYDTLARVELPAPIPPGGGVFEFDLEWTFIVPRKVFRRFGIEKVEDGAIFEIAQWFPAVAVYDDVHGWNTLPYIGTGEFYTNFGNYDVKLTLPRNFLVVATGELQNPEEVYTQKQVERLQRARTSASTVVIRSAKEVGDPSSRPAGDGPLTWHFQAEDVRTFAWAASDAFILDAAGLDGTLIQSAYPREALPLWSKATQMLRTAIEGYNRRWFRYPYPVATNVNGIEGGMEYPMIVFCRTRRSEEGLYGVTAHEIGHNWFPMVVNTDERRHAWMDEGFNTFINYYSREDWFHDGRKGRGNPTRFAASMTRPNLLPIETAADQLSGRLLGQLEYAKTAAGLIVLREKILGPERFDYAFRTYIQRWAFKSPRPADFFRSMEDAAGADLAWFWRGWFLETGFLDQKIESVEQARKGKPARVVFRNLGRLVMPLEWQVTFEDGSIASYHLPVEIWFHSNQARETLPTTKRIEKVVVDPDRGYPDVDRGNNVWDRLRNP
ncbi:MAG: M1 family metallopeptidase [Planctomycetota bacterium]